MGGFFTQAGACSASSLVGVLPWPWVLHPPLPHIHAPSGKVGIGHNVAATGTRSCVAADAKALAVSALWQIMCVGLCGVQRRHGGLSRQW